MGLHIGTHFGIVSSKMKNRAVMIILGAVMSCISIYGFYLFISQNFLSYMLLKVSFAFFDYSKAWWLVILENLAMLVAWAFAAFGISLCLKSIYSKIKKKEKSL